MAREVKRRRHQRKEPAADESHLVSGKALPFPPPAGPWDIGQQVEGGKCRRGSPSGSQRPTLLPVSVGAEVSTAALGGSGRCSPSPAKDRSPAYDLL
jgi:hypothetical protein